MPRGARFPRRTGRENGAFVLAAASCLLSLSLGCAGRPAPQTIPHPAPQTAPGSGAASPAETSSKPTDSRSRCIVLGAKTEPQGQAAERAWLREHFPGGRETEQSLAQGLSPENRVYDDVVMVDAAGIEHRVCFDITEWFGKF